MRLLLFVLSLTVSVGAFASQPLVGNVERNTNGVVLITNSATCYRYTINAQTEDAAISIRKLSTGDAVTASGVLNDDSCTAHIDSIDYVGLRKMLGYWYSDEGIITVKDFNSLSYYPIKLKEFQLGISFRTADPINYRYSVTPSVGKEWVVFLSDTKSTTFATIQFNKGTAVMKIYDPDNGEVTKTLRLAKWGDLK
ncbi:hypothetical protein [Bdellovibrio reynosensis]|uniref:Uncharacterized protein n=1 Tax=Bdellovibrio reynosensis TaxID=2835041 RepID=A0ABY4CIU7_9BACT|nr:hypothetical protein [Bdellovibrio reynosensis]UOF02155.1 hypothetical protein MNR06_04195 [Bdellovibrio reynosensis]